MSSRRNLTLAGAALLLLAGGFFYLRSDAPAKPKPTARATDTSEPAPAPQATHRTTEEATPAASGSNGLPASHFEEKRRMQEEAAEALLALEEAKYANVNFSAARPGPPPPRAAVQGKTEEEMSNVEKAAQVERMVALLKDRIDRTRQRAEDATKKGDKDEAQKQEMILTRLRQRQGELEYRGKILRGEDIPQGTRPSPAASGSR